MDKIKATEEARIAYAEALEIIDLAEVICLKIEAVLPEGWTSEFSVRHRSLRFSQRSGDAMEFRVVCGHVEQITGEKMYRTAAGGPEEFYLLAWCFGRLAKSESGARLEIDIELNRPDGCNVTFEEETTMRARVDRGCLGVPEEKEEPKP